MVLLLSAKFATQNGFSGCAVCAVKPHCAERTGRENRRRITFALEAAIGDAVVGLDVVYSVEVVRLRRVCMCEGSEKCDEYDVRLHATMLARRGWWIGGQIPSNCPGNGASVPWLLTR